MTDATSITVRVPLAIRHRPGRNTVVTPMTNGVAPVTTRADPALVKALAWAFRYQRMLYGGHYASISEMAAAERIERGCLGSLLRLPLLAQDLLEVILDGRQPSGLRLPWLMNPFPTSWAEQRDSRIGPPDFGSRKAPGSAPHPLWTSATSSAVSARTTRSEFTSCVRTFGSILRSLQDPLHHGDAGLSRYLEFHFLIHTNPEQGLGNGPTDTHNSFIRSVMLRADTEAAQLIHQHLQARPCLGWMCVSFSSEVTSSNRSMPSRPMGKSRPNSVSCERMAFVTSVRWCISISCTRCNIIALCCRVSAATKRMMDRTTVPQTASTPVASFLLYFT
jgi:hypothetical protein